jgi:hypothetical protein
MTTKLWSRLTHCGFEWGSLTVTRLMELKNGCVMVEAKTPRTHVTLYATRTGHLRVYRDGVDLAKASRKARR